MKLRTLNRAFNVFCGLFLPVYYPDHGSMLFTQKSILGGHFDNLKIGTFKRQWKRFSLSDGHIKRTEVGENEAFLYKQEGRPQEGSARMSGEIMVSK